MGFWGPKAISIIMSQYPDTQCMVYVPTLITIEIDQMHVNMPYIEHLGYKDTNQDFMGCHEGFECCSFGKTYDSNKSTIPGMFGSFLLLQNEHGKISMFKYSGKFSYVTTGGLSLNSIFVHFHYVVINEIADTSWDGEAKKLWTMIFVWMNDGRRSFIDCHFARKSFGILLYVSQDDMSCFCFSGLNWLGFELDIAMKSSTW